MSTIMKMKCFGSMDCAFATDEYCKLRCNDKAMAECYAKTMENLRELEICPT